MMGAEMLDAKILDAQLKKHKLSAVAKKINAAAQNSICISAKKADEKSIPVGASKIGGRPDVEVGFKWPEWKGAPMSFLAQFDLKEVSRLDNEGLLPKEGRLLFFSDSTDTTFGFDPKDSGGWLVHYIADPKAKLKRVSPPKAFDEWHTYTACKLTFRKELTIPPGMSFAEAKLEFTESQKHHYTDLGSELGTERQVKGGRLHQLLGHPFQIQTDMAVMSNFCTNGIYMGDGDPFNDPRARELVHGSTEWRLLFQLDTDSEAKMQWSDAGMLYFWLKKDDLKNKAFDKGWFCLQCS